LIIFKHPDPDPPTPLLASLCRGLLHLVGDGSPIKYRRAFSSSVNTPTSSPSSLAWRDTWSATAAVFTSRALFVKELKTLFLCVPIILSYAGTRSRGYRSGLATIQSK
jgi:hypothetical protein